MNNCSLQVGADLYDCLRQGTPQLTVDIEGALQVDGQAVIERHELQCGMIVLGTAAGAVVLSQAAFAQWADLIEQGLARDLEA